MTITIMLKAKAITRATKNRTTKATATATTAISVETWAGEKILHCQ